MRNALVIPVRLFLVQHRAEIDSRYRGISPREVLIRTPRFRGYRGGPVTRPTPHLHEGAVWRPLGFVTDQVDPGDPEPILKRLLKVGKSFEIVRGRGGCIDDWKAKWIGIAIGGSCQGLPMYLCFQMSMRLLDECLVLCLVDAHRAKFWRLSEARRRLLCDLWADASQTSSSASGGQTVIQPGQSSIWQALFTFVYPFHAP